MTQVNRKVIYRLYPSAVQERLLADMLGAHQRLYNAALQQRIWAYRAQQRTSVSFADQCKQLTELRGADPEYNAINAQSAQVTLKRLDLAFQAFFRRVKANKSRPKGKKRRVGFPRFKSYHRFSGWGYKTHGDGWRLFPAPTGQHGKLRLAGVGLITMRGCPRTPGEPKTLEILHKQGKWYAAITLACKPQRQAGTQAAGLDWGVETFATLAVMGGMRDEIENPRHLRQQLQALKRAQRSLSRKVKGSQRREQARQKVAGIHGRIANRRQDFLHQESAKIVKQYGLIATEELNIVAMTAHGGKRKRGLNREVLSTAPSTFLRTLRCKAEEAGVVWFDVPTRTVKPSQTCSQCGRQAKKGLTERIHQCPCGLVCGRDENAARVMLNWALRSTGQELARRGAVSAGSQDALGTKLIAMKRETPTIALA